MELSRNSTKKVQQLQFKKSLKEFNIKYEQADKKNQLT